MTEPESTDTAVIDRELAAIDAALDAGAATATDPYELELQELALLLEEDRPEAPAAFEAELARRVAAGFPRERRLPRLALPRVSKPVFAGAVSIVAALAVTAALVSSDNGGSEGDVPASGGSLQSSEASPEAAQDSAGEAAAGAAPGGGVDQQSKSFLSAPAPPRERSGFAPGRAQRIERSASLTLAAPGDELDTVADQITSVTDRNDGFVLRSNVTTGDDGPTGGTFELRIPAARLQAALADLAKLADVRSRSQSGQDVTRRYANTSDRLQIARAERRSLLRRLENASTDAQTEALRRRLDANAGEIRSLRAQIRELRLRTDYAKVNVTLDARDGAAVPGSGDSGDGLGGAVDDAVGSLAGSVEILIRALGILLPLGVLAGAAALGARALRRRRREAALS